MGGNSPNLVTLLLGLSLSHSRTLSLSHSLTLSLTLSLSLSLSLSVAHTRAHLESTCNISFPDFRSSTWVTLSKNGRHYTPFSGVQFFCNGKCCKLKIQINNQIGPIFRMLFCTYICRWTNCGHSCRCVIEVFAGSSLPLGMYAFERWNCIHPLFNRPHFIHPLFNRPHFYEWTGPRLYVQIIQGSQPKRWLWPLLNRNINL
jgi:hypothetical protein